MPPILPSVDDSVAVSQPLPSWQRAMKEAVRDPVQLCRLLQLPAEFEAPAIRAARLFPVFAPLGYIARMRCGDPYDPLLRQVLPLAEEEPSVPGFTTDPVGDAAAETQPGLLQKYAGRTLMVTTGACAVHCRYCFRRHFPYGEAPKSHRDWQPAMAAIAADPMCHEVILSGGDPLTLVDPWLEELASQLSQIPHLRRLRIHTRLPVIIPQRVGDRLLGWLVGSRLTPIVVVHANHPAEINAPVAAALGRLIDAGIPVLNQAVLLRGVNDRVEVLADLCERLIDLRVMPYYLHQMDRVAGSSHFEVPETEGRQLVAALRTRLPGYAVPCYVRETPGEPSKTSIA